MKIVYKNIHCKSISYLKHINVHLIYTRNETDNILNQSNIFIKFQKI
jgi:hypothetical protein